MNTLKATHKTTNKVRVGRQRPDYEAAVPGPEEFSAALFHELNQPLAAILYGAEAARRLLAQTPPKLEELPRILEDIAACDQRAVDILRSLRGLFIERENDFTAADINAIIVEVAGALRDPLAHGKIRLTLNLVGHLPAVAADPVQLRQVLRNLLINAIEALSSQPPGARSIEVRTRRREAAAIEVAVRDTGAGIDPIQFERVFDPFFTTKPHGLGVGLALCRQIVVSHRGRLWADNHPAGGAVFQFTLPAGAEDKP